MDVPLRIVVADDEPPALAFLVHLLEQCAGVAIVGLAATGEEAVDVIEREHPDLALLDVQMPGLDAFGVIHLMGDSAAPLFALVTALDEYADLAREVGAIDYLLKPIAVARLGETLACARNLLKAATTATASDGHP